MNIKMTLFNLVLARMTSEDKENSAWHAIWPHREMPVEEHYDLYNIDAAQRRHRGYRPSFRVRGTDYPRRNLSRVPTVCFKVASRCRMGKASYIRNDTDDIGAICLRSMHNVSYNGNKRLIYVTLTHNSSRREVSKQNIDTYTV